MRPGALRLHPVVLLVVVALVACGESPSPVDPDSPTAVFGVWESVVAGVLESTVDFDADGTFIMVDADLGARACSGSAGDWSTEDGTLITTTRVRDEGPVTEPEVRVPYEVSGGTLTLRPPGEAAQEYARGSSVPLCRDYGWMALVMSAEVDGVLTDFGNLAVATIDLEGRIREGRVIISGFHDPMDLGFDACTMLDPGAPVAGCRLLTLDLSHELGAALYPGTYPIAQFGPDGLRGRTRYLPMFPSIGATYGSNDSDPTSQPWEGQIDVSTLTADVAEGTFEFVVYDGDSSGPPYPMLTVTNGFFRLSFD